jgi:hypothetical protein
MNKISQKAYLTFLYYEFKIGIIKISKYFKIIYCYVAILRL